MTRGRAWIPAEEAALAAATTRAQIGALAVVQGRTMLALVKRRTLLRRQGTAGPMDPPPSRWTAAEDAALRTAWAAGCRGQRLADAVPGHRHASTVRIRAERLGLHHRVPTGPHRPGPRSASLEADKALFRRFMATVPSAPGTVDALLWGLRQSGNWRELAEEWVERHGGWGS